MNHRYGDFEQVNGATVNDALDRADKAERQRDKLLAASQAALDWITSQNGYPAAMSDRLYEAIAEIEAAK